MSLRVVIATLVVLVGQTVTFAPQVLAGTLTFTGVVDEVRLGGLSSPFALGQTATIEVDFDDAVTSVPGNDFAASNNSTLFYGATSIRIDMDTVGVDVLGTPDGSGPNPGNTDVNTSDSLVLDKQSALIGSRNANPGSGGSLSVLDATDLGLFSLVGLGIDIQGQGTFNGLSPNPDPTDALIATLLVAETNPASLVQREIRMYLTHPDQTLGQLRVAFVIDPAVFLAIDIKPGSSMNPINVNSQGDIPVAVFGSASFDVADIDPDTLAFGPFGAAIAHSSPHFELVDGDGFMDMIAHFRTQETGIELGMTEMCLTGELLDGTAIEGCDSVSPLSPMGCGIGFELVFVLPPLMWARRKLRA